MGSGFASGLGYNARPLAALCRWWPAGQRRLAAWPRFYTDITYCRMDIIFLDGLRASTLIGIYPRERAMPQTVEVSLQIGTSTASAGASDDIRDTIDYAAVAERLHTELAQRHFNLLERLAEYIATLLIEDFGATWVRVSIAKLGIMRGVQRVGVIIERGAAG